MNQQPQKSYLLSQKIPHHNKINKKKIIKEILKYKNDNDYL